MKAALAQLNPTVGDLAGNSRLILDAARLAARNNADLLVLPELAVSGYPPRDLVQRPAFVEHCERALSDIASAVPADLTLLVGVPLPGPHGGVTNSVVAIRGGKPVARYDKRLLPTYDVFDERRYFVPGDQAVTLDIAGVRTGIAVCEDLWRGTDAGAEARYRGMPDPIAELAAAGASVVAVPSASPFVIGKPARHEAQLAGVARTHGITLLSVNQAGANDDLIFDGNSGAYGPTGLRLAHLRAFSDDFGLIDLDAAQPVTPPAEPDPTESVFDALVIGVRDYVRKTRHERVIVGLSGGIDSAVTACIAAAALGPDNVLGMLMPSRYSSDHSITDAQSLAANLGIKSVTIPIEPMHAGSTTAIDPAMQALGTETLAATPGDLTDQNLQSRMRGTIVMAISNRTGALVLTTGNKSELAVGYCTLYGDTNGALAVLSDCAKGLVYNLARHANEHHARIAARWPQAAAAYQRPPVPRGTITKPPSAELAPGQRDDDSLPDYDTLDTIVERYIERLEAPRTIAAETGFEPELVDRICRQIDINEYKRRQMAVGLKITPVAFGPGRRMPVVRALT